MEFIFDMVFIANAINFIGVLCLIISHTFISLSSVKKGFVISSLGGFFVSIGSFLLGSYPVVLLNILWIAISAYGYFSHSKNKEVNSRLQNKDKFVNLGYFIIASLILLCFWGNDNILAYFTTFLYVSTYFLFASKIIKKETYLLWCAVGFIFIFPHLIDKMQYSVLINETYGFIVSIIGIYKTFKNKQTFEEKKA